MQRIALPVAVLILGLALALESSAQEPVNPAEQTPAPAADDRAADADDSTRRDEPTAQGPAPTDYEASEQISEDLSVSFPVDI